MWFYPYQSGVGRSRGMARAASGFPRESRVGRAGSPLGSQPYRSRNFEEFRILGLAQQGHITGPDGSAFGSAGPIINCPIVFRLL